MNIEIAEQIKSICAKYYNKKNFYLAGQNMDSHEQDFVINLLKLPVGIQIIAFMEIQPRMSRKLADADFGIAICDSGVFWKSDLSNPNQPQYDGILYCDLVGVSFKTNFFGELVFDNEKQLPLTNMRIKKSDIVALLTDLKQFSRMNMDNLPTSPSSVEVDYADYFIEITSNIQSIIQQGILGQMGGFYSMDGVRKPADSLNRLRKAMPYLKRSVNEANIDNFMQYYSGKTQKLLSDEFPLFGYEEESVIFPDKYWVCTNKRIYRNKKGFNGDFLPVIELANIKKYSTKEGSKCLVLHYGFMIPSDEIDVPKAHEGMFFTGQMTEMFDDLVSIFHYLNSL